jgi:hypothetical protein
MMLGCLVSRYAVLNAVLGCLVSSRRQAQTTACLADQRSDGFALPRLCGARRPDDQGRRLIGQHAVRGPCRRLIKRSDGVAQTSCAAPGRPGTTACLGCLVRWPHRRRQLHGHRVSLSGLELTLATAQPVQGV